MLKDEIKKRINAAMRERRDAEKEILKLTLGEIQTAEARGAKELTDEEVQQIIRKLVKSNEETRAATADATANAALAKENEVLASLLPKGLTTEELVLHLGAVKDAIIAAGNDGQATGVAMKHLKSAGITAPGNLVQAAVKQLRASAK